MVRHVLIELVLPLFIFVVVMLTLFADLSWIPLSSIDRNKVQSLEDVKKHIFD
tara:strand:+ start:614 stop:772 length:159 start_codon:yes stop_codon:yes gene_type:complete